MLNLTLLNPSTSGAAVLVATDAALAAPAPVLPPIVFSVVFAAVIWTTTKEKLQIIPTVVVFFLVAYYIIKALGSWAPFPDTWIFTGSALATYGLARGYVEFWLVWIAVDAVGTPLLIKGGYYPSAALYLIYGAFVIWGFVSWLLIAKKEKLAV